MNAIRAAMYGVFGLGVAATVLGYWIGVLVIALAMLAALVWQP